MLRFKSTVDFRKMTPQTLLAMLVADQLNEGRDTWITSVSDGAKGRVKGSKHNTGNAVDIDTDNHPNPVQWISVIKVRLDRQYDVILHSVSVPQWRPGDPIPADLHAHLEFDPPEDKTS